MTFRCKLLLSIFNGLLSLYLFIRRSLFVITGDESSINCELISFFFLCGINGETTETLLFVQRELLGFNIYFLRNYQNKPF